MSKELEYINEIQNELDKNPRDKWKAYWNGRCNVIRKSLTRPLDSELEEATSHLEELVESYEENTNFFNQNMRYINTIKSTIDKLKGVE